MYVHAFTIIMALPKTIFELLEVLSKNVMKSLLVNETTKNYVNSRFHYKYVGSSKETAKFI